MDRKEILEQFETEEVNGEFFITSLGKFESEPIFAPAIHEMVMNGFTDVVYDGDTAVDYLDVDDELREEFPEINEETDIISLTENEEGFVSVRQWSKIEWDNFVDNLEMGLDEDMED